LDTHMFNFEQTVTSATWIQEIEKPLDEEDHHEHHHHDDDEDDHDEHHHHHHDHDEHEHHHHDHDGHHHHHHHHDGEGEAEEYGIGTFVYFARKPFDINKFDWFVAKKWPKNIIRAKGICYFDDNTDMSYLFEQAGVQKKLTEAGQWYATAPEDELQRMLATEPGLQRDWDPVYGDRMEKLVFIGRDLDRKAITEALDACLTDL
ncbi:MAG: GTP-binding protein, partial [Muribaculaceae bacterium]|nr:GTP-binding protein [Muribaculaceae bacterium]